MRYPNGVSQTRAARVPIVYPLPTQRGHRTFVQPRWGNRAALSRVTRVRGIAANPGLWNITRWRKCHWSHQPLTPCRLGICMMRVCTSIAMRVDFQSNQCVFTPTALHSIAGSPRQRRTLGTPTPAHANTPTGFHKPALPAYRSFIHYRPNVDVEHCPTPLG